MVEADGIMLVAAKMVEVVMVATVGAQGVEAELMISHCRSKHVHTVSPL